MKEQGHLEKGDTTMPDFIVKENGEIEGVKESYDGPPYTGRIGAVDFDWASEPAQLWKKLPAGKITIKNNGRALIVGADVPELVGATLVTFKPPLPERDFNQVPTASIDSMSAQEMTTAPSKISVQWCRVIYNQLI